MSGQFLSESCIQELGLTWYGSLAYEDSPGFTCSKVSFTSLIGSPDVQKHTGQHHAIFKPVQKHTGQ